MITLSIPPTHFQHFTLEMYSNRLEPKRIQLNTILGRVKKASYTNIFLKPTKRTKLCPQFSEQVPFVYITSCAIMEIFKAFRPNIPVILFKDLSYLTGNLFLLLYFKHKIVLTLCVLLPILKTKTLSIGSFSRCVTRMKLQERLKTM